MTPRSPTAGWNSAINSLRASGGDVIASFGGASGTELGVACTSVASLQAAYKSVIDQFNLTRIDLDIEGAPLDNTTANDRRNQALANLQAAYAASGKTLSVDYTLPVDPTGLLSDSLSLLNNAKSHNLNVNLVNIMTMDYGSPMDMGQAAISAANALHSQLGAIWTTKTSAQLWAMEGNTPMIGVNDTTSEVFTTGNASTLESFAASNGIQELSFWALGRDNQATSGTSQSNLQFTNIFKAITGGGTTPPPPPPPSGSGPIHGYGGKCVDVAAASSANGTAIQLYTCNGTNAQVWTHTGNTLQALGKCMDVTVGGYRQRHEGAAVGLQRHRRAAVDGWRERQPREHRLRQMSRRDRAQLGRWDATADLGLRRQCEPELDATQLITGR